MPKPERDQREDPVGESTTRPPGPPAPRFLGGVFGLVYGIAYILGGERLLGRLFRRYGPIVAAPMFGLGRLVLVSDPVAVKRVLTTKPDILLAGEGNRPVEAVYGSGSLFVQDEPEHLRRRRLVHPSLHGGVLKGYVPIIESATLRAMEKWPTDRPVRFLDSSREMTLDIIVRVIFGIDDPAEVHRLGRPFEDLLNIAVSDEMTLRYMLRRVGGLRFWPKLARTNRELGSVVLPEIARRRREGETGRTDILALLLAARDDSGESLSDSEIRDDLVTLALAGHETTATALAWLLDVLLHRPAVLDVVREEAETGETAYTHAVINETLRLHPPNSFTGRITTDNYVLGDHMIEPGTRIVLCIDAVNKYAGTYELPDEFVPTRFLHKRPETYAWIPFGGGVKRCLGASFAMVELTTIVHTLLLRGDVSAVSADEERPVRHSVVTVPRRGTRIHYRPRNEVQITDQDGVDQSA